MNYKIRFLPEYGIDEIEVKNVDAICETYEHSGIMEFVQYTDDDVIDICMFPKDKILYISKV